MITGDMQNVIFDPETKETVTIEHPIACRIRSPDVFALRPVGPYHLYFGTDKSPLVMDQNMNIQAKLAPVLNGTFKYKEAGNFIPTKEPTIFVGILDGLETSSITWTLRKAYTGLTWAKLLLVVM